MNVDAFTIGGTTAQDEFFSGSWPACTAPVANLRAMTVKNNGVTNFDARIPLWRG